MAKRKAKADAEKAVEDAAENLGKVASQAKKRALLNKTQPGADEPSADEKLAAEKAEAKAGAEKVEKPKPKTKTEAAVEKKEKELEITDNGAKEQREVDAKDALGKAVAKAAAEAEAADKAAEV